MPSHPDHDPAEHTSALVPTKSPKQLLYVDDTGFAARQELSQVAQSMTLTTEQNLALHRLRLWMSMRRALLVLGSVWGTLLLTALLLWGFASIGEGLGISQTILGVLVASLGIGGLGYTISQSLRHAALLDTASLQKFIDQQKQLPQLPSVGGTHSPASVCVFSHTKTTP